MNLPSNLPISNRLGYHYYPDTVHYGEHDLQAWLPELGVLGASWITLLAPSERAIPEFFLKGLLNAGVQPVLHFPFAAASLTGLPVQANALRLLFSSYARWGVRYVALYDRPNCRASWQTAAWAQDDLVERFLDQFLPIAQIALEEGLAPVFPPLEPGGDYWDLAFLQTALRGIQRRGNARLLEDLALSAYAWAGNRPLNWGAGGSESWPGAKPYSTPPGVQDHQGFRIFDWYLGVSQQQLGRRLPVLLLRAGSRPYDHAGEMGALLEGAHALTNLALARLAVGEALEDTSIQPMPPEVLACNFWLLAATEHSPYLSDAWFGSGDKPLPVVDAFSRWTADRRGTQPASGQMFQHELGNDLLSKSCPSASGSTEDIFTQDTQDPQCHPCPPAAKQPGDAPHPIAHYVLLPLYAWGAADWDLQTIQPLLEKSHPTIGFSLAEARLATRVTVIGSEGAISGEALDLLRMAGCSIERLQGDGTLVAT